MYVCHTEKKYYSLKFYKWNNKQATATRSRFSQSSNYEQENQIISTWVGLYHTHTDLVAPFNCSLNWMRTCVFLAALWFVLGPRLLASWLAQVHVTKCTWLLCELVLQWSADCIDVSGTGSWRTRDQMNKLLLSACRVCYHHIITHNASGDQTVLWVQPRGERRNSSSHQRNGITQKPLRLIDIKGWLSDLTVTSSRHWETSCFTVSVLIIIADFDIRL